MQSPRELRRYRSLQTAIDELTRAGIEVLRDAIATRGTASLVLTGGSAVGPIYRAWGNEYADAIDWHRVHFFWGDERYVDRTDDRSNFVTALPLLQHVAADPEKQHYWRTELEPQTAVKDMQRVLSRANYLDGGFDLTLLGMGPDGHVASLFPLYRPWTDEHVSGRGLVAFLDDSPKPPAERFTFTLELLNRSRTVYLLPFGERKREAFERLMASDPDVTASHVSGREATVVWTDIAP